MPPEDIGIAEELERQGYFARVRTGDQKAASLFARLFAHTANPTASTSRWGWLTKQPGEAQVDGWAEDAVCWTNNPSDLHNVVDLVIGAGAAGASLTSTTTHTKERRPGNKWAPPQPLTADELNYLKGFNGGTQPPQPDPCAAVKAELAACKAASANTVAKVDYEQHGGDAVWDQFGNAIIADYKRAGRVVTDANGTQHVIMDARSYAWGGRTMHDDYMNGLTLEQSIAKHRVEWCALLGIPVS